MPPINILIVGAGQRGNIYASFCLLNPNEAKVSAICDENLTRLHLLAKLHNITQPRLFTDYKAITRDVADAAIVSTNDQSHADITCYLSKLGFHILCEKPMATTISDCIRIRDAIQSNPNIIFACGHVLRYSPYTKAIKKIIDSGEIGQIVNITHVEPVGWYHFAHSYVRGNWKNQDSSSFSLLAKCCHDIDLLMFYLHPLKPIKVSSFGSLNHFKKANKPLEAGSALKCSQCSYSSKCPYSAEKIYMARASAFDKGWPISVICGGNEQKAANVLDLEEIVVKALKETDYGTCVYEINNDVCDNQVVNIEFEGGKTASLTMVAFTESVCQRYTRFHGTRGEIIGDMKTFSVFDFNSKTKQIHNPYDKKIASDSHGGGDFGIMNAFVEAVKSGSHEPLGCGIYEIFESHALVFAAEQSRTEERVLNI